LFKVSKPCLLKLTQSTSPHKKATLVNKLLKTIHSKNLLVKKAMQLQNHLQRILKSWY